MRLPIDTAALNFTCSLLPEPVIDFTSRQQKADANEQRLNAVSNRLNLHGEQLNNLAQKLPPA